MIRHSEIIDKKKNHGSIREKILASVGKYPRYPHDLYDACGRDTHLSRSAFRQLLDEMVRDGDIHINANNSVLLPKPPPETKPPPPAKKEAHPSQPPEATDAVENRPNEPLIHCLVNRSHTLKHPKQKKHLDSYYYAHKNYTPQQIPLASVCEETLLKGYQFVPGEFKQTSEIHTAENWKSQQLFLIEFDDTTEKSLDAFIQARRFVKENAWLVTESIRSGYDDPDDPTCNGQLRPRLVFCMPDAVKTQQEREWIYTALVTELPGCDTGSANSMTNGGLGRAGAAFMKIGKIVDTDWFNAAIDAGRKAQRQAHQERERAAAARERKQAERAAMGNLTERDGELPLEALAKSDPSLFLESLGLSLKSERGQYQHWGRPEKRGDTALSVWQSDRGNYQIRVFANSIPVPPSVSGAMPLTRFYCYYEFHTDIEGLQPDSPQWKDINAHLASRGYGTWLSDEEFKAHRNAETLTNAIPLSVADLIAKAPIGINEPPSYRHFTPEDRLLIRACNHDPYASYTTRADGTRQPVWTSKYQYLYETTGQFALNGQPPETEKHRVYNTLFKRCSKCGGNTTSWIDRFRLIAGEYCDNCHQDTWLNSYLNVELHRKIRGAVISDEGGGYVSDDPVWSDYTLWQPRQLTQLGAAMNTGKTTFVKRIGVERCQAEGKMFIICVPRISLARSLFSLFNREYGPRAFGLFHEGSRNKFIGRIGAICCLSSLPKVFEKAAERNIDPSDALIFIDEIDFSYQLTTLVISQATTIKRLLEQALHTNGLVVAGQTEYTASLESLAAELETDEILAYYKNAESHGNSARIIEYPDIEGKSTIALAGFINSIERGLGEGHHVYAFCAQRRQVEVAKTLLRTYRPLTYTALSKGGPRANQFLRDQKLTDTAVFLATGAAAVGLSILDEKAVTRLLLGLVNGRLNVADAAQECVRDRGLHDVEMHVPKYTLPFPVAPTDAKEVSVFDLLKKRQLVEIENAAYAKHVKNAKKLAETFSLNSLAEQEVGTYMDFHIGEIAGFNVEYPQPPSVSDGKIILVKQTTKDSLETEKKIKTERALSVIEDEIQRVPKLSKAYEPPALISTSEIRSLAMDGAITEYAMMGHQTANAAAKTIGFDDLPDTVRGSHQNPVPFQWNDTDLDTIRAIVTHDVDPSKLARHIYGYIAKHSTQWITDTLNDSLMADVEWSAIQDYRELGIILKHLIDGLQAQNWDAAAFQDAIMDILNTKHGDSTLLSNIKKGTLGISGYRKARFMGVSDDIDPIHFITGLIQDYYPAVVVKTDGFYILKNAKHLDIFENALNCWLAHHPRKGHTPQHVKIKPIQEVLTPKEQQVAKANRLAKQGATVKEIVKHTGLSVDTVRRATKDSRTQRKAEQIAEAKQMHADGMSYDKIGKQLGKAPNTIKTWVNE